MVVGTIDRRIAKHYSQRRVNPLVIFSHQLVGALYAYDKLITVCNSRSELPSVTNAMSKRLSATQFGDIRASACARTNRHRHYDWDGLSVRSRSSAWDILCQRGSISGDTGVIRWTGLKIDTCMTGLLWWTLMLNYSLHCSFAPWTMLADGALLVLFGWPLSSH